MSILLIARILLQYMKLTPFSYLILIYAKYVRFYTIACINVKYQCVNWLTCIVVALFTDILLTVLKSLSKEGLFKRNNVWYPANYCYNVVWNLSDESSELAASLGDCGIIGLCATNVAHKPYIDHLEKKVNIFLV